MALLFAFVGVTALLGGATLLLDPSGAALAMPLPKGAGSPFANYLVPGVALIAIVGMPQVATALQLLFHRSGAHRATALSSFLFLGWMTLETFVLGTVHPVQIVYVTLALLEVAVGFYFLERTRLAEKREPHVAR